MKALLAFPHPVKTLLRDRSYRRQLRTQKPGLHPRPSLLPPGFRLPLSTQTGQFRLLSDKTEVRSAPRAPRPLPPRRLGWPALRAPDTDRDSPRQQGMGRADRHRRTPSPGPPQGRPPSRSSSGPAGRRGTPADAERGSGIRRRSRPGSRRGEGAHPGRFPEESAVSSSPILTGTHPGQGSPSRPGRSRPVPLPPKCRCRRSTRAVEAGACPRRAPRPLRPSRPPIG